MINDVEQYMKENIGKGYVLLVRGFLTSSEYFHLMYGKLTMFRIYEGDEKCDKLEKVVKDLKELYENIVYESRRELTLNEKIVLDKLNIGRLY